MSFTVTCAITCLLVVWQPFLRDPEFAWIRVTLFVLLGMTGLIPFIHLVAMRDLEWAIAFYRPLVTRMIIPAFSGAVVYANKFPESLWPGRFDFLGSSHNLWHVAVLLTLYGGYFSTKELLRMALSQSGDVCIIRSR